MGRALVGRTMAGLVAGLVQAAARHVGAGIAARAAYHASVRVEAERLARPLAPGNGKGAAAAQAELVLVPAAELVEAVCERRCSRARLRRARETGEEDYRQSMPVLL